MDEGVQLYTGFLMSALRVCCASCLLAWLLLQHSWRFFVDFLSRKTRILVRGSSHFLCGNVPFWEVFPVCTHHFWHSMDFFSSMVTSTKKFLKNKISPIIMDYVCRGAGELNHCRITTDASQAQIPTNDIWVNHKKVKQNIIFIAQLQTVNPLTWEHVIG